MTGLGAALATLDDELGQVQVLVDGVVVGRGVNRARHVPLHVRDFFRALVDQQQQQLRLRVIGMNAAGDVLQKDGFARPGRCDN
ncbi:MAG: hypothetical protein QM754_16980 [Tepidisphaeraceae bacterium]